MKELNTIFIIHKQEWQLPIITVGEVYVSLDLAYSKIYVSVFDPHNESLKVSDFIERLNLFSKQVRSKFCERVGKKMRKVPEFQFFEDETFKVAKEIQETIKKIKP